MTRTRAWNWCALFGCLAEGRHSLQIEINRKLYMDEVSLRPTAGYGRLKADLRELTAALILWTRARRRRNPTRAFAPRACPASPRPAPPLLSSRIRNQTAFPRLSKETAFARLIKADSTRPNEPCGPPYSVYNYPRTF